MTSLLTYKVIHLTYKAIILEHKVSNDLYHKFVVKHAVLYDLLSIFCHIYFFQNCSWKIPHLPSM